MKKLLFIGAIMATFALLPSSLFAQSTEGTDFWVSLMRGDAGNYDSLFLSFSAKEATKVYISNAYTQYYDTVVLGNNDIRKLNLNKHVSSCYVKEDDAEIASNKALHVTADKPISLIAANYKNKSFDVASILPTSALLSEYRIQCYDPYSHSGTAQGSHFAIIAADDNVIVDITPTVNTYKGKLAGTTFATDTLQKGQVYYVWTGNGAGSSKDFTGTVVKARDNKKIAVFNGDSHTNIPSKEDRDHIYSQAMPVNYWGKRFAITSSLTTIDNQKEKTASDYKKLSGYWERIDKIRVQAVVDGTVVYIDGDSVYTFDFTNNPKHYYEFDFGAKDEMTNYTGDGHRYFEGASHYIETSCPSAVHLFMTSNRYDHGEKTISGTKYKYCNGDPSLIWVNPIEQKIDTLTFGTFETKQVTDHFINIVTLASNQASVKLDGTSIAGQFKPLNGNPEYAYARITNVKNGTHTLTADSGFIAHVYGFGQRESYGYPAGGLTKDLTAYITINGQQFKPGEDNLLCGDDKVDFSCELNYNFDSIYWYFGDGKDSVVTQSVTIEHFYEKAGKYNAYVRIFRPIGEKDECIDWNSNVYDSIPFQVNIGNYKIDIVRTEMPYCSQKGEEGDLKIYLDNSSHVSLAGDSVRIKFNEAAKQAGFQEQDIQIVGDSVLVIPIPAQAEGETPYTINLRIGSECPNSVVNEDLEFALHFDVPLLAQHYNNVLGIIRDSFPTQTLSDFVWFHDGDTIPDQLTSVLYLDETNPNNSGEYYVCFNVHEAGKPDYTYCTCPLQFKAQGQTHQFSSDAVTITATYVITGNNVFVNADWNGQTDIECYAQWITTSGNVYQDLKFDIPDGGCTIPAPKENGLYLLRVVTGKETRSFKFLIQK